MSNLDLIKLCLDEMRTHVLFDYKNISCGIDPLSKNKYDLWYGDKSYTAKSVDEALDMKIFDGNSINQISDKIENLEI